jgi:hypothetical protein
VDKNEAEIGYNYLKFISLRHFKTMSKKFVFSVEVKSRKKMAFPKVNNDINAIFVNVNFLTQNALI